MPAVLEVRNLNVWYGRTEILRDVTFSVPEGEVVALLGGNGSGKTTILNTLSGLLRPRAGSVMLGAAELGGSAPAAIVRAGMVQVPQGREVFASMSVLENLRMGAATRTDKAEVRRDLGEVFSLFPRLHEYRSRHAGFLSGGEQQQVAIARSLMARPKLLLMDEPSAGLAPKIVDGMIETIRLLNGRGLTILLVEQNVGVAAATAGSAHILQNGSIVFTGPAPELIGNEQVLASYLGS
ncbi:ABC transporter ATP-binding protein [Enterovirga sp. CN4-39]|uniref:ABC transporter ATP-binding protein n=1 Tax=Enterovirga sp. CN4-39 TaxID=3400910 RepID=UPI003C0ADD6D